jgi:hypothetical protein
MNGETEEIFCDDESRLGFSDSVITVFFHHSLCSIVCTLHSDLHKVYNEIQQHQKGSGVPLKYIPVISNILL